MNNVDKVGRFITFEGVEGAGKTTNIQFIAESIAEAGHELVLTREPGGTELSEAIRELLISKNYPEMHITTELLLIFAARSEHIQRVILPALNAGKWVLCDRFTDASYAYQGAGRGIPEETIKTLEVLTQNNLTPDYTFLFDLPADIGLSRAKSRGETDRFEQQHIDFFNTVRNQYLLLAKAAPERFRIIDSAPELNKVQSQISHVLSHILLSHE